MRTLISQLRTEFLIEYRSWSQSGALLLFVIVLAYVISRLKPELASTPEGIFASFYFIFWVFLMLISINITLRTEGHRDAEEHLMVYTLISPLTAFVAKGLFNIFYLGVVGMGFYLALYIFYAPQIALQWSFVGLIMMGAFAIGSALSFTSAIASHLVGQNTLLSILSIPLLIPTVLVLYQMSMGYALQGAIEISQYMILMSISFLSIALSLILFPMIWRQ